MWMNWNTTSAKHEREAFFLEAQGKNFSVAEMARRFGISRKTAHKWLARFAAEGRAGLVERSRAPRHHPNALSAQAEARVLELKTRWPHWGAPKLWEQWRKLFGTEGRPSESSISRLLQRHGLVRP